MTSKKLLKDSLLIISFIFLLFSILTTMFIFRIRMEGLLNERSRENISEVQKLYSEMIKNKFSDQFALLDGQSKFFENLDINNQQKVRETIMLTKGIGDFKKLGLIREDGTGIDCNGKNLPVIKNKEYFLAAMASKAQSISNRIELDENLEPTLTLLYPIKNQNSIFLSGTFSYNVLKKMASFPIFSGESYFYIVANNGNIILCNKDKNKLIYNVNLYDYILNSGCTDGHLLKKIKIDILNNRSGQIELNGTEGKKLMIYSPLDINDWYIISVVPKTYIYNQQRNINLLVYTLITIVSFIMAVFSFLISIIIRKNTAIKKDNERLTIANNQAQTLIFEYDLNKKTIDFSGDTQFMLGTDKKHLYSDFVRAELFRRVHSDDKNIINHLENSIKDETNSFSAEFRYKTYSHDFIWVRMTGSTVKYGSQKKFIGSISNVNAQILHEQELKNLAERDKLSNLLNKTAMEHKIKKYISSEAGNKFCVLIIIDLDNFKSINDKLGHMTGDMAIIDTAKKISLIFSEKDYLSRFGGDEFCILMRFSERFTKEEVYKILKEKGSSLCAILKEDYFNGDTTVQVTASIGMALYPDSGTSYEELFKTADEALYSVKQNGKDNYKIAGF